ncbi:MAG TPA: hypothetical protein EYM58_05545, partial [Rhodospirillales bacterium]|nr:hypothetical protein [Rhodospirillales bacterium]
ETRLGVPCAWMRHAGLSILISHWVKILLSLISQIFKFMRVNRKMWMAPIILGLVALCTLLVLAESSVIAPFIYAIF